MKAILITHHPIYSQGQPSLGRPCNESPCLSRYNDAAMSYFQYIRLHPTIQHFSENCILQGETVSLIMALIGRSRPSSVRQTKDLHKTLGPVVSQLRHVALHLPEGVKLAQDNVAVAHRVLCIELVGDLKQADFPEGRVHV